jgi:hypothetical protein
MAKTSPETAELTVFRLKKGHGAEDVRKAGRDIDRWLRRQPGFVSRSMVEHPDGSIIDIVVWRTEQEGRSSAARLLGETAASAFHDMVESDTVQWHFGRVLF